MIFVAVIPMSKDGFFLNMVFCEKSFRRSRGEHESSALLTSSFDNASQRDFYGLKSFH